MENPNKDRSQILLHAVGLISADEVVEVNSLTGGVSSDIAMVKTRTGNYCTKFALSKLKVSEEWRAPVRRNAAEYAWLEYVSAFLPENVPQLYGRSIKHNGFVMEYIQGEDIRLWKSELLEKGVKEKEALAVARALAKIHSFSAHEDFDRKPFDNLADFHSLRLDPYFGFLIEKYPRLSQSLQSLIDVTAATQFTLIHGDVSPKNILFKGDTPVFLDAECATMGDPAFDVGFCLNHLLLKALHLPEFRNGLLNAVKAFWQLYSDEISWEPKSDFERRLLRLLPAFMLARVDSKSPVEYLDDKAKAFIRSFSPDFIKTPASSFEQYLEKLGEAL